MKSPEQFLEGRWSSHDWKHEYFDAAANFMREYALHVAAEQDKITRHAAAEIVNGITGNNNFEIAQSIISAHRDIMNLQTKIKSL